jgi:hypothetical protein
MLMVTRSGLILGLPCSGDAAGAPLPVRDQVDLAGQATAGSADRVVKRLGPRTLVIRQSPVACGRVAPR